MTSDDTAFWIELLGAATVALWCLAAVALLRARAVRASLRARPFVRPGERAVLLVGTVAPTLGESAERSPVVLTITQTPELHARHVRWIERDRSLTARPFDLVCDGGSRVRVEPGADVLLARSLSAPVVADDQGSRTRAATLPLGARAAVYGALHRELVPTAAGAHLRDGSAVGAALRAPAGGPMTVFGAAPDEVYVTRARTHRNVAALGTVGLVVALGVFTKSPGLPLNPSELSPDGAAFVVVVMLVMAAEYAWRFTRSRPWYERPRLDEVEPAVRFRG